MSHTSDDFRWFFLQDALLQGGNTQIPSAKELQQAWLRVLSSNCGRKPLKFRERRSLVAVSVVMRCTFYTVLCV